MPPDSRLDPEMLAFTAMMARRAESYPPQLLERPLDAARAVNDALNLTLFSDEPRMAESADKWVLARGRRLLCRLHRPSLEPALPVLIYLHGGGWVWNSVDTHDPLMRCYAQGAGCAVIGPDYALSPEAAFPQAIEEVAAVVRWVAAHGAEWGLDSGRMVLGGDSAGANLALGAALLLRQSDPGLRLRGLLLNYGVFDDRMQTPSYAEFAEGYGLTAERMRFYWNCYAPNPADRLSPYAAPIRADLRGLPPCRVTIAELDVLADENRDMTHALRAAGVAVEEETFPGTVHGFLRAREHVAAARRAIAAGAEWLKRTA
ncbi:alpha/beta hydrolase [Roseomonas sp. SSH11]|uniref:Alpha/beta hydrolase n=1 Tax=Pararoseomonas baculiformis TaxID=2820812 RepID=A0ABS4ADC1_9PROT|nr:alpha/beta hydrolase [Pararoseomonas baculiformis]MBP0445007.1 alpha/beta hydrolase [Pararoseomonas baculiformis]